ncbi:MAG: mechanosensitive ion channel [Flavobacteriaceae bacterium]|nr:mechanosensitive ion channel [Flavobacteriaceae bacterium]
MNDWIKIEDNFGRVDEIGIQHKNDHKRSQYVIIPNSKVTESILTNYSEIGTRRVAVNIPIPYDESFPRVKKLIL